MQILSNFWWMILYPLFVLVCGVAFTSTLMKSNYETNFNFKAHEVAEMVRECEANLPRNQSCEVVISVKVKE